jgi:hypothetical protein
MSLATDTLAASRPPPQRAGANEARELYLHQGYLHARGILSRALVQSLQSLMLAQFELQAQALRRDTGVDLNSPLQIQHWLQSQGDTDAWFRRLPRATQHLIRGEFPLEVRLRAEFLQLADEDELTDLLRVLLGQRRLRLNHPPMLRFKVPGMTQSKVPLHQDGPYFSHIRSFATVWIPMCAITEECGGVSVLEGSHRGGPVAHDDSALWGNFVPPERAGGPYRHRHILMDAGDALIFGPHLLHYSQDNRAQHVRCSIDSRWFGEDTATSRQYYDLRSRQVVKMF